MKVGPWTLLKLVTYLTTAQPEVHTYKHYGEKDRRKKGFQTALKYPA